jgi:acetyltransferase-like isoleucine patch superfamily enzyme
MKATGDWAGWARERLRAAKGLDEDCDLSGWGRRELRGLGQALALRLALGAVVRGRIGRADGYVLAERRVRLLHPKGIEAGRGFSLEEGCEIVGLAREGVRFGDRCTVGRFAIIRPTNVMFNEVGEGLSVGDNSNIGPYAFVGCSGLIRIGSDVLMGPGVNLLGENHNFEDRHVPIRDQGVSREGITIGDNCWLGAGSVILAGTTVGAGAVVAAGAVVSKDVPPDTIVAGVPARVIRERGRGPEEAAEGS